MPPKASSTAGTSIAAKAAKGADGLPTIPSYLFVQDTNCSPEFPRRTHTMTVQGAKKDFVFESGKRLKLPFAVAMKFLKEPAFDIRDDAGKRYEPMKDPKSDVTGKAVTLGDGEVIVKLEELNLNALVRRVNALPGGEMLSIDDGADQLIAFLRRERKQRDNVVQEAAKAREETPVAGDGLDEVNMAELDALLSGGGEELPPIRRAV